MPDRPLQKPSSRAHSPSEPTSTAVYTIRRKGSVYNISGPQGRVFTTYKSARIVGPRWEELTHTPWPYESSAYEPGLRLWELGIIKRERVGKRDLPAQPKNTQPARASVPKQGRAQPATVTPSPKPILFSVTVTALPAPRIDLAEQARLMRTLQHDPTLLFTPVIREALQHEVEYHLPQARWAAHLLKLLDRYDRQQRHTLSPEAITAKHIAWQEQRIAVEVGT